MKPNLSPNPNDNDVAAALGAMSAKVLVADGEAFIVVTPWPDRHGRALLGSLRAFEFVVGGDCPELHFKYSIAKQAMLGLARECFTGDDLFSPHTTITRASLWTKRNGQAKLLCRRPASLNQAKLLKLVHAPHGPVTGLNDQVTITSHGARILATNFWGAELERQGTVAVSVLEGHLRLLVPDAWKPRITGLMQEMSQMQVAVLPVSQWQNGKLCAVLIFDNGVRREFISVAPDLIIGPWPEITDDGQFPASVWVSQDGKPHCLKVLPALWTVIPDLNLDEQP